MKYLSSIETLIYHGEIQFDRVCFLWFYTKYVTWFSKYNGEKEETVLTSIFSNSHNVYGCLSVSHIQSLQQLLRSMSSANGFNSDRSEILSCGIELTLSQISPGFYVSVVHVFRKHCKKRRNCSLRAISPFPTMFFYPFGDLSASFDKFEIVV